MRRTVNPAGNLEQGIKRPAFESRLARRTKQTLSDAHLSKPITHDHNHDGVDHRGFLHCMAWAGTDLKGQPASRPVVVFAQIPLWSVYPDWGWGTEDSAQAPGYVRRLGSVTVLNGHIHQVIQKVEGRSRSTRPCLRLFRNQPQARQKGRVQ